MASELEKKATEEALKTIGELLGPLAKKTGQALGDLADVILNPIFNPIRLKNEKSRLIHERNIKLLTKAFEPIPEDKVLEIAPEMSIPILERLSYTSSDEIAAMFVELLGKAANQEKIYLAHPAFRFMIERMSVDEAKIIEYLSHKDGKYLIYLNIQYENVDDLGLIGVEYKYLTEFIHIDLKFPHLLNSYIENLIGMGVLVDIPDRKASTDIYNNLIEVYRPLFENLEKEKGHLRHFYWHEGILEITFLGSLFINACMPVNEKDLTKGMDNENNATNS